MTPRFLVSYHILFQPTIPPFVTGLPTATVDVGPSALGRAGETTPLRHTRFVSQNIVRCYLQVPLFIPRLPPTGLPLSISFAGRLGLAYAWFAHPCLACLPLSGLLPPPCLACPSLPSQCTTDRPRGREGGRETTEQMRATGIPLRTLPPTSLLLLIFKVPRCHLPCPSSTGPPAWSAQSPRLHLLPHTLFIAGYTTITIPPPPPPHIQRSDPDINPHTKKYIAKSERVTADARTR